MIQILNADARAIPLADASVNCCVTSPPYFGLRDYGVDGQIGLEQTPDDFVAALVAVFREVRRVLRDDGVLWLNLGDSYANNPQSAVNRNGLSGSLNNGKADFPVRAGTRGDQKRAALPPGLKPKDLIGIPWRVAFALQADGWYLRQDIIWSKPNPMPESVKDRCTKAHEYIFMLTKSARYWYDAGAIAEPASKTGTEAHLQGGAGERAGTREGLRRKDANGSTLGGGAYGRHVLGEAIPKKERRTDKQRGHSRRHAGFNDRWDAMEKKQQCSGTRNKRSVWTVATQPYSEAHFATYPEALIEPCILAGCPKGGLVLDPFCGSGTTLAVANRLGRSAIGLELNPKYIEIAKRRVFGDVTAKVLDATGAKEKLLFE